MADNQPDMEKVWERIEQIANSQQLDRQKVWEKIEQISTSVYIHEDRIAEIQMQADEFQNRTTKINEEIERLAKATTKSHEVLTQAMLEFKTIVANYIRGIQNGGSAS